jgi:ParB family chromosome partitioning protein
MGHARALLAVADDAGQRQVARDVIAQSLSVRETETLVKRLGRPAMAKRVTSAGNDVNTRAAEDRLHLHLGTRVRIVRRGNGGKVEIDFANEDELQRLFEQLMG